jgi:hypothetical protein
MKLVQPSLLALGVLAVALACERSPIEPSEPLGPNLRPSLTLRQVEPVPCSDLPYDSVTQAIGPSGGQISIGPHTLRIPKGALGKSTVSITAVLLTGTGTNVVRLGPDGLRFRTAVYLRMSYANCQEAPRSRLVAYMNNGKIVEKPPSVDDPVSQGVTAALSHFSNYAVAW